MLQPNSLYSETQFTGGLYKSVCNILIYPKVSLLLQVSHDNNISGDWCISKTLYLVLIKSEDIGSHSKTDDTYLNKSVIILSYLCNY